MATSRGRLPAYDAVADVRYYNGLSKTQVLEYNAIAVQLHVGVLDMAEELAFYPNVAGKLCRPIEADKPDYTDEDDLGALYDPLPSNFPGETPSVPAKPTTFGRPANVMGPQELYYGQQRKNPRRRKRNRLEDMPDHFTGAGMRETAA